MNLFRFPSHGYERYTGDFRFLPTERGGGFAIVIELLKISLKII
jgi:hypothetical protein